MHQARLATLPQQGFTFGHRLIAASVLVVAAAVAALPVHAQGHHGHGMGGGGMGGGHGMMMFAGSPERVARGVDHMLDGLNASDAQRSQIKQIALGAAADLKAQRDASRDLRQKAMLIFTAPSVDAAAAEAVRQQMSAQHDQSSKRMLQAMLDVSKVLTPEQRARLGEGMKARQAKMKERMERIERHHRETPQK